MSINQKTSRWKLFPSRSFQEKISTATYFLISYMLLSYIKETYCYWKIEKMQIPKTVFRSSHQRCYVRKGVLRNFTKFTGKHLYQSIFFNKVGGLRHAKHAKQAILWSTPSTLFYEVRQTPHSMKHTKHVKCVILWSRPSMPIFWSTPSLPFHKAHQKRKQAKHAST